MKRCGRIVSSDGEFQFRKCWRAKLKTGHYGRRLRQRVVGQDTHWNGFLMLSAARAPGSADPKRPIGSFIFLGPTGVARPN